MLVLGTNYEDVRKYLMGSLDGISIGRPARRSDGLAIVSSDISPGVAREREPKAPSHG